MKLRKPLCTHACMWRNADFSHRLKSIYTNFLEYQKYQNKLSFVQDPIFRGCLSTTEPFMRCVGVFIVHFMVLHSILYWYKLQNGSSRNHRTITYFCCIIIQGIVWNISLSTTNLVHGACGTWCYYWRLCLDAWFKNFWRQLVSWSGQAWPFVCGASVVVF